MKELPKFEELMRLAKEDPTALEKIRQDAVEELINSAPEHHQRRLRGLQFQVDMERKKAKNPMDSCIRISKLMHNSFCKLRDNLNEAQQSHIAQLKKTLNQKAKRTHTDIASNAEIAPVKKLTNLVKFPSK